MPSGTPGGSEVAPDPLAADELSPCCRGEGNDPSWRVQVCERFATDKVFPDVLRIVRTTPLGRGEGTC